MTNLDHRIFLTLNAPVDPAPALVMFADFEANWLVYAVMLLMVVLWIWGCPRRRGPLLAAAAGAVVPIGLNLFLGEPWADTTSGAWRMTEADTKAFLQASHTMHRASRRHCEIFIDRERWLTGFAQGAPLRLN